VSRRLRRRFQAVRAHSVRFFRSALYDLSPWGEVARQALWLLVLGAIFGGLARLGARRLLA
jgi:hypothetical protein